MISHQEVYLLDIKTIIMTGIDTRTWRQPLINTMDGGNTRTKEFFPICRIDTSETNIITMKSKILPKGGISPGYLIYPSFQSNRNSVNNQSQTSFEKENPNSSDQNFTSWRDKNVLNNPSDQSNRYMRGHLRALEGHYYKKQRNRCNDKQSHYSPQISNYEMQLRDVNKAHIHSGSSIQQSCIHSRFKESKIFPVERTLSSLPQIIKTTVQNLNLVCVKPQRAGIIIYTIDGRSTYFGLGLDAKSHDLTDFAGQVIYVKDLDVIHGAIREFEEETLGIFDKITADDIKSCPVIYDRNNLIIFVHMDVDPNATCIAFNNKYKHVISQTEGKRCREPEVCGITWLTWEEFQDSINQKGIIFSRVQKFLAQAEDFSYLL
jgi:hypothetical protein